MFFHSPNFPQVLTNSYPPNFMGPSKKTNYLHQSKQKKNAIANQNETDSPQKAKEFMLCWPPTAE